MRGKVSDQDLTNYALNELSPEERLYVESMLAISEECRHDIYQMLELGETLKEGFELDEQAAVLMLDDSQREKVLTVPRWNFTGFLQRAAAVALLAAGTAYAVKHPGLWGGGAKGQFASAGVVVADFVDDVKAKGFARTAEEFTARMQAATSQSAMDGEFQFVIATPAICTPPVRMDMPSMPDIGEM